MGRSSTWRSGHDDSSDSKRMAAVSAADIVQLQAFTAS